MGPLSVGFEYPCETEPIRDLPTARLVVSAVNRSTLTRVSSRSEISASVLTSQGREITVDSSRLLSPHTLRNRVVQSFSSSISLCIQVRFLSPDGAAGGLKPEYPAASGPRDYGRGPTTGTQSQTTCNVRRGTGRVVHCTIIERFFLMIGQLIVARDHRFESALLNYIFESGVTL